MAPVIIVAEDDTDLQDSLSLTLRLEGFDVHVAADGGEAIDLARETRPDLVLLDVNMPRVGGFDACRRLRADAVTANTPIIILTGNTGTDDKIEGFAAGADDYLAKPFDPTELVIRVRSVLRRTSQLRDLSPLTGLPGNFQIAGALERLLANPTTQFAVLYADLDNFKPFNDHYGFMRGDDAIKFTAQVLTDALAAHPGPANFAGHVGGDDFVLTTLAAAAEAVCQDAIWAFDIGITSFYDDADRARGFIEVADRVGVVRAFPMITISIGIASTAHREIATQWEAAAVATEMKQYAKRHPRSAYEIDRRRQ
jgi:diguanylate cyclase (GGDEF)-like protein